MFAQNFQIIDERNTLDIHQDANTEIQNGKSDPALGEFFETTHFDHLGDIHGNEINFEDHIEKNDLIVLPQVGICYENGNVCIQNGNIGSTVGENTEIIHHQNFHQKKSFSAAGNANIHQNVINAGCFIQANYVTVQQAPQITMSQHRQIKDAEDCLLNRYMKASEKERKDAAMVKF